MASKYSSLEKSLKRGCVTGPNVKRLVSERVAQIYCEKVLPEETLGKICDGLINGILQTMYKEASKKEASKWVQSVLKAAHAAPGGEQWPTDEDMAGEILHRIEAKRRKR